MFWNNVKSELDYQGITQKELADKSGINLGTLKNQICRNIIPNVIDGYKIAAALNVSLEYLVTGSDKTIPRDIQEDVSLLMSITKEERIPINIIIKGQVEYLNQK